MPHFLHFLAIVAGYFAVVAVASLAAWMIVEAAERLLG